MSCPENDDPKWLTVVYLVGLIVLWFLVALLMLGCIFGCMIYYW